MITLLVYDDNKNRRESLKTLIEFSDEMVCKGDFENCMHIIEDVRSTQPDLILMDIEMPGMSGIEGVATLKKEFPQVKVIMQTAFDDDEKVFNALQAGAEGYILKSASAVQIIQSIKEVMQGGAYMTPSIALKVMRYFNHSKYPRDVYKLSNKENEVLSLLAGGHSYKMIADELQISYFTVNNHIKKIYEKLHVHSLGEAVALAYRERLI